MRRLAVVTLLAALAGPAFAQEPPAGQPSAPPARQARQARQPREGRGDLQALGLTEDQKQRLREVRRQYANDPEGRRKAVREILTPEQREKLKELRRARRARQGAPQD